jgi:2-oxoacid:acceptor oxidoreductase delta subunit (pyruvate/2-ketoisovalerate family)
VGINSVERFLGDEALKRGWRFAPPAAATGKRVLVVGAGPSGLSAAYHLARMGHAVTIREAGPFAGGMMRFGIPKYRLPRDVLDAEVKRILDLGVTLELNAKVDDVLETMKSGAFDAAFLAVGAHIAKRAYIPAGEAAKILDAVQVLRDMEGPGRGTSDQEYTKLEEGVLIKWLSTIKQAGDSSITVEKMVLDAKGVPQPTGEVETLEADSVVLALGQDVDLSLLDHVPGLEKEDGVVKVGPNMMTGHPGIFAGGDMVPAERTVTVGVGHGKKAARHIDAWLRGATHDPGPKHEVAAFDKLNAWYYADAPKTVRPVLELARRTSSFDEVVQGLDESNALFEARRCLSCGNCFECDNCYGVCPDNAVVKLGPGNRFRFNYDYCKGCGMCAAECPCGAIRMVPEEI